MYYSKENISNICKFFSQSYIINLISSKIWVNLIYTYKILKHFSTTGCLQKPSLALDLAPAWEHKGHQFNSQSGHMPRLQTKSPTRAGKKQPIDVSLQHQCFSPSLSPSLPLSLKINKIFLKNHCLKKTHFKYKETYTLKVSEWRKIYHVMLNKRKQK